ncbi:MAG TPA: hypothetical protein VH969_26215 [Actinophytocola sp.]|uniref:hypothetical protein n=1 Tax=Actinophytocola sp. TaxID=1872138 RepID=UPI002F9433A4
MSWEDFYLRRDALDRVVESGELTVPDMFRGPTEVLLALQHRWSLQLKGRIELAELDEDPVEAVGAAWRETAAANPALRQLLDRHANHPALRAVTKDEHRMLATTAGLTDPGDGPAEQATVGAAFVALQRNRPAERHNAVERFLRKLVPSG